MGMPEQKPQGAGGRTILVVEDAPEMAELMTHALLENGFTVIKAASIAALKQQLIWTRPDLVLLDINLPDGDGLRVACDLRLRDRMGLVFVTARDAESDRLAGLERGGDDYITKPVVPRELIARVNNVLRLRKDRSGVIVFDGWQLDTVRRELFRPDGGLLSLTTGEFNILAALAAVRPQPLSRDFLLDVISNRDPRSIAAHTIDTLISRLRRKLQTPGAPGGTVIATVRGVGYALTGADQGGDIPV